MPFKVLDLAFVLLRLFAGIECPEVAAFTRLWVLFL
jgi:hypothetical protein